MEVVVHAGRCYVAVARSSIRSITLVELQVVAVHLLEVKALVRRLVALVHRQVSTVHRLKEVLVRRLLQEALVHRRVGEDLVHLHANPPNHQT